MTNRGLYVLVLVGLTLLLVVSMGNGLFQQPYSPDAWPYRLLRGVCHQIPERSFVVNGVQMAANARCFGIFAGLWGAWLILPLMNRTGVNRYGVPGVLLLTIALQLLEKLASLLSVWNSSNFSRFFIGLLLGVALVHAIADQFAKQDDDDEVKHGVQRAGQ